MTDGVLSLGGRSALVTGGASGIGAEIARVLSAHGADVAVGFRPGGPSEKTVEGVVSDARGAREGARAVAVGLDAAVPAACEAAVAEAESALGGLDVLVCAAGTNVPQPALEVDEATWDRIHDVNLKGLFFSCQAFARHFRGRSGAIVNVASQMGLVGWQRRAVYCASKAGVVNLTRALAVEWAPLGIRVNAVAPSFIATPLAEPMLADPAFRAEVLSRTPLGRIGEPREVANAVLYLAGDASSLVTGHTLALDGGWTAQ